MTISLHWIGDNFSSLSAGAESEDPAAAAAANPPDVVILDEYTAVELAQIGVLKKNGEVRTRQWHP